MGILTVLQASFCLLSGRKGSQADEGPDLGISYEVLPTGAGELPEVRNVH